MNVITPGWSCMNSLLWQTIRETMYTHGKVSLQVICLPQGITFTAVPSKSIAIGGEHFFSCSCA